MRYLTAILVCLSLANSADAGWGHWRHGFGVTVGYGGLPYYGGYPCYGPGYGGPGYGGYYLGGYGYGAPLALGYYGYPPYGIDYYPASGYLSYRLPAYSEPAELNYGPQAVKQFLGLPRDFALGALREPEPMFLRAEGENPARSKILDQGIRVSNAEARRKAERLVAGGDELFRGQNYHGALQRYKLAAKAAPDLPEPYWRQGHALIATNNFELAANAFKRAIALSDDLARDGFELDQIYNGAQMSKARHLESLAGWALEHEASADSYFLLGVFLTYDGDQQRAQKFFERASDLAGLGGGHIAGLLNRAQGAQQPAPLPVNSGTEI